MPNPKQGEQSGTLGRVTVQLQSSALFRGSGQRDDRRRWIVADPSDEDGQQPCANRPPRLLLNRQSKSDHYGDARFMDEQPRLTDLVPRRLIAFFLIAVAGSLVIAFLEMLYVWMPRLATYTASDRVAAFDLAGAGNLATWFSALALQGAAFAAILVYLVRRHHRDDYNGNYHVWLWAAMCWLLVSVDVASQLHEGFRALMVTVTGTRLVGDGSIWWVTAYFFLLAAVGLRLLVDMRECWLSTALLVLVGILCGLAVVVHLDWWIPGQAARQRMVEAGAQMSAAMLLALCMLLHARHVIRDAEGLLPRRAAKPKFSKAKLPRRRTDLDNFESEVVNTKGDASKSQPAGAAASAAKARVLGVDSPHGVPQPATQKTAAAPSPPTLAGGLSSANGEDKLNKSDKKALRKRLEEMRHQREGGNKNHE
jgi:hypothetical protein